MGGRVTVRYEPIKLTLRTKGGGEGEVGFIGSALGRTTGHRISFDFYRQGTEIYRTRKGNYITYFYFRGDGGKIQLADYVRTESLDLGAIRSALKAAGIYPGPSYSEAVYNSLESIEFLEKVSLYP